LHTFTKGHVGSKLKYDIETRGFSKLDNAEES
jgi:hypothetical protein